MIFHNLDTIEIIYLGKQGELEHHRSKWHFAHSGKNQESRTASIADQEAMEWFISKVNEAWDMLKTADKRKTVPQARTSPEEHYHIAVSTWNSHDLTAWLGDKMGDPAVKVHLEFSFSFIIYILWVRISFHVSKTTCSHESMDLPITEMSMTSPTRTEVVFSYTTIDFLNMLSSESTTQHTISVANKIPSIPGHELISCSSHKRMNVLTHIGMLLCA